MLWRSSMEKNIHGLLKKTVSIRVMRSLKMQAEKMLGGPFPAMSPRPVSPERARFCPGQADWVSGMVPRLLPCPSEGASETPTPVPRFWCSRFNQRLAGDSMHVYFVFSLLLWADMHAREHWGREQLSATGGAPGTLLLQGAQWFADNPRRVIWVAPCIREWAATVGRRRPSHMSSLLRGECHTANGLGLGRGGGPGVLPLCPEVSPDKGALQISRNNFV